MALLQSKFAPCPKELASDDRCRRHWFLLYGSQGKRLGDLDGGNHYAVFYISDSNYLLLAISFG
ncbi:hypothetical protein [Photobacterium nomapromontoriensis]|uniref:hypothetical protein n=1 Tax=Photobacterium nomapromontoriensis TaxID=2910237 RepID=UPI003D0D0A61